MENTTQTVEVEKEIQGKTVISFSAPSPKWAVWLFRAFYWGVFAFILWIGSTKKVMDADKVEIILIASCIDKFFWGMARGLGVKKDQFEADEQ